jgi:hypothetical protein
MKSKIKTTFLLLTLISCTIWLAGCKKTSSPVNGSIVGTWNINTQKVQTFTNGSGGQATTGAVQPDLTVTFTSDGHYTSNGYFFITGDYTLAGTSLMMDSAGSGLTYQVLTLNANNLSIQNNDTSTITPQLIYNQFTTSMSR